MHIAHASAANALGNVKGFTSQMFFAYGLMQSVAASGDGATPKTGFKVIAIAEEYTMIRDFGLQLTSQSLVDGPCDKMVCKTQDGKTVTLYFDITIAAAAEAKALTPPTGKP